jgi:hypothetical protein
MTQGTDRPGKGDTVRLPTPGGKVAPDERRHPVRAGELQTSDFELMNTRTVEALIRGGDAHLREEMGRLAEQDGEGVLALDRQTGHYRVLETESLDALMNRPVEGQESVAVGGRNIDEIEPETDEAGDDELQLVSTQLLRQILGKDVTAADEVGEDEEATGSNPYDCTPPKK